MSPSPTNPLTLLREWYAAAQTADPEEPNAMALATVGANGAPALRMVLMKAITDHGVHFFTNQESRKADDIAVNPRIAACLYWQPLERQVRLEGRAEKLDDAANDVYFATRPRESRLGAWASLQSQPLPSRAMLEARMAEYDKKFPADIPRPPHWGGYLLRVTDIEFWQAAPARLHHRRLFRMQADQSWMELELFP